MTHREQAGTATNSQKARPQDRAARIARGIGRVRYTRPMLPVPRNNARFAEIAVLVPGLALTLAACLSGCASTAVDAPEAPQFIAVPHARYQQAFDAACAAAREQGLVPELADRQAGVMDTKPRLAGSVIEPWAWRDLDASDVVEGTFGFERRRAHFEFVPAGFRPTPPEGTAPLAGAALPGSARVSDGAPPEAWELRVSVSVERQFRAGYQGPAYTRALGSYSRPPSDTAGSAAATGVPRDASAWTPIARDERLERMLMARVAAKLAAGE